MAEESNSEPLQSEEVGRLEADNLNKAYEEINPERMGEIPVEVNIQGVYVGDVLTRSFHPSKQTYSYDYAADSSYHIKGRRGVVQIQIEGIPSSSRTFGDEWQKEFFDVTQFSSLDIKEISERLIKHFSADKIPENKIDILRNLYAKMSQEGRKQFEEKYPDKFKYLSDID